MKIILIFLAFIFSFQLQAQTARVEKLPYLEDVLKKQNDTIYVVNFWATWCVPCVKELPYFEELNATYASQKVKVILISLDAVKSLNNRLIPFLKEKNIKSEVVLLDEPDYNSWLNKVDPSWGGSIPATIIISNQNKTFYEKAFKKDELFSIVEPLIIK